MPAKHMAAMCLAGNLCWPNADKRRWGEFLQAFPVGENSAQREQRRRISGILC